MNLSGYIARFAAGVSDSFRPLRERELPSQPPRHPASNINRTPIKLNASRRQSLTASAPRKSIKRSIGGQMANSHRPNRQLMFGQTNPNATPLTPWNAIANTKYHDECSPNRKLLRNGSVRNSVIPNRTATIFPRRALTFTVPASVIR